MTILWLMLATMMSTGLDANASTHEVIFNDTLTKGEGAQRNLAEAAIRTIVIDAGHGGRDEGCSGLHSEEKEIALKLALAFGKRINESYPEIEVIYTRETDVFIPLYERAAIANRAKADLFVSLHCNYIPNGASVHGSETYVMGLHTADHNLSVAKRENAAIRLESDIETNYDFDPDSPTGHIILSMFQHAFLEKSVEAAEAFEQQLAKRENRRSRGVRQAGFVVLKETAMPSVLVETGYLSNSNEESYLISEKGQTQTVDALFKGLVQYMRNQPLANGQKKVFANQTYEVNNNFELVSEPSTAPEDRHDEILSVYQKPIVTTPSTSTVKFYVQLAASSKVINTDNGKWKNVNAKIRYIKESGLYKYQAGPSASLEEVNEVLKSAKKAGFTDAWIVAYKNDKRLSKAEIGL